MSVHPTSKIRLRACAATGIILASLGFTSVAAADGVTVTQVSGNPSCSSVGASYAEVKIEPVRQGTTTFGNATISGSIAVKGAYFDWSSTAGVDAVIVKGGPMANVYRAGDEMTSGTGLHAPINADDGRPYGLSHISFCSDGVDSTTPDARTPGPCEPGGATTMPDGTPCEALKPCEPGGATTMPDGKPCAAPAAQTNTVEAEGEVLGTTVRGGRPAARAQMSAPGTCVDSSFAQVVRGKGIRRVTMFANGKRLRVFRGSRSRYAVTIDPRNYPNRVMRLKARVQFVEKSGKRPQTFRMTVLRCAQAAVAPAFAG